MRLALTALVLSATLYAQTTPATIDVSPAQPWTDTNIDLRRGDAIVLTATGTLTVTQFPTQGTPANVAVQPNAGGNLVYTFDFPTSGSNGTIEAFQLSAGLLAGIQGNSATGVSGEFDQSGKFLFVVESSNGAASALDAFDVSASPVLTTPLANVGWAPGAWQPADIP